MNKNKVTETMTEQNIEQISEEKVETKDNTVQK